MYSKMLSTKLLPFSRVLNMLVDRILQTQHRMPNNAEITLAVYCISFWKLYRTAWKYPYRKRCTYLCDNTTWKQKKYNWYFEIMSAKHFIKCCVLRELYFAGTSKPGYRLFVWIEFLPFEHSIWRHWYSILSWTVCYLCHIQMIILHVTYTLTVGIYR